MRRSTSTAAACAMLALAACDTGTAVEAIVASKETLEPTGVEPPWVDARAVGTAAYLDCFAEAGLPLLSAHRGGGGEAFPENSETAFHSVTTDGLTLVEIDVRQSADGTLVLMHDSDLSRTTTCRGELEATTFDELQSCQLRSQTRVWPIDAPVALSDMLRNTNRMRTIFELDMKDSARYEDVIAEIRAADAEASVILIATSVGSAGRLARLAPEMAISAPIDSVDDLDELLDRGVRLDNLIAWTGDDRPDPTLNAALRARGVPVKFGAFDDTRHAADIADLGVDIIGSDDVPEAREELLEAFGADAYNDALARCAAPS